MQINQVLWVINGENQNVIPVRIVEKVTKETASGTKTEFIVETVTGKKISLTNLNGPYFESSLDASNHLLATAHQLIKKIIAKAEEAAQKFGHVEQSAPQNVQLDEEDDTIYQEEPEMVTLPDGRRARVRVKLPEA
jgi:hypothetical protein